MRRFIKNIFIFLIPFLIFIPVTSLWYFITKLHVESELSEISGYENIIMGDSQMQRINPRSFRLNTYNFSNSAEHYYFTYQKIKRLLGREDHRIKQIILGISAHNFAPVYERLFDITEEEGRASLRQNFYFMDLKNNDFFELSDLADISTLKGIYYKPGWGGYKSSELSDPDSSVINRIFRMHYLNDDADTIPGSNPDDIIRDYADNFFRCDADDIIGVNAGDIIRCNADDNISDNADYIMRGNTGTDLNPDAVAEGISEQIEYLYNIDSICHAHNIRLILVTTPYHPDYLERVDSLYINLLDQTVDSMKNITYISYLNYRTDPKIMSDAVHLNSRGSDIFSKMINDTTNSLIHDK